MERHFHQELEQLRNKLLQMSFRVEEALNHACEALFERNDQLAREVIEGDKQVDRFEIEIDDKGHSLFALGQPMAADLRKVMMILKMNTDLERIGDHAVNIAEKGLYVMGEPKIKDRTSMSEMVGKVQKMFRDALDSFLKEDAVLARQVLLCDDEVDQLNVDNFLRLRKIMEEDERTITIGMNLMMVSHNLERIADLSSNIAEEVIYLKQGKEIRHGIETT
ncbi:MAG: phosphate signaling complex protein PhoU [Candidatus Omnitrophica bacterium]|nr:phosphate signaling complex protein PhoU [Candidatus Omnitrophota bacterium]